MFFLQLPDSVLDISSQQLKTLHLDKLSVDLVCVDDYRLLLALFVLAIEDILQLYFLGDSELEFIQKRFYLFVAFL